MPNSIKRSSDGLGLQGTKPARAADLIKETEDGDATRLADVRVFAFDDLLLIVDIERVETEDIAELIASAARDTKSVCRVIDSSVQIAGNGYQVHLPTAEEAGFTVGDTAPCHPASSLLVISSMNGGRLTSNFVAIRKEQASGSDSPS